MRIHLAHPDHATCFQWDYYSGPYQIAATEAGIHQHLPSITPPQRTIHLKSCMTKYMNRATVRLWEMYTDEGIDVIQSQQWFIEPHTVPSLHYKHHTKRWSFSSSISIMILTGTDACKRRWCQLNSFLILKKVV